MQLARSEVSHGLGKDELRGEQVKPLGIHDVAAEQEHAIACSVALIASNEKPFNRKRTHSSKSVRRFQQIGSAYHSAPHPSRTSFPVTCTHTHTLASVVSGQGWPLLKSSLSCCRQHPTTKPCTKECHAVNSLGRLRGFRALLQDLRPSWGLSPPRPIEPWDSFGSELVVSDTLVYSGE